MEVRALPPLPFTGHRGPVYALSSATRPGHFISGSGDGLVVEWVIDRPDSGRMLVDVGQAAFSLLVVQAANILLIGTESGDLHVIDLHEGREVQLLRVHQQGLYRMAQLPDGRCICAGGDGSLSIWQLHQRRLSLLRQIPLSEDKLRDLSPSADGRELAVACGDGTIRVLDTILFNELHTLRAPEADVLPRAPGGEGPVGFTAVCHHPSKPVLLSGGKDGHLRTWLCAEEYRHLIAFPAHKAAIYAIRMDMRSGLFATASRDKSAKVWRAADLAPVHRLDRAAGGHSHSVNDVLWQDGLLITASDDRRILGWTL